MAKFIKFNISNTSDLWDGGVRYVNVDQIESVYDVVSGGAYSVQIVLSDYVGLDDTSDTVGGRVITIVAKKAIIARGAGGNDPDAITVAGNMPSQAVLKAMSANPGGVVASAQLNKDGAGGKDDDQMYWNSFAIQNSTDLPIAK
tara:strand:+ start:758 stop:1189 length:432 start_codon:yes stop_codon:yes gene_type:complete